MLQKSVDSLSQMFLKGLAQILEKNEADPEKAAELMYQILEIA